MIFKVKKDLAKMPSLELSVYLSVQALSEEYRGECFYLSLNHLLYFMFGNGKKNKSTRQYILNVLNNSNFEKTQDGDYIVDKKIFATGDSFVYIYSEDLQKILQNEKNDKYRIVQYMYVVMNTIDGKRRVGNMSHEWIAGNLDISLASSYKYMQKLIDNEIIYVNSFYKQNNIYGHSSNKEYVNNCTNITDRYKKSMAAKYNQVVAGKVYAADEMREIFSYINSQNEYEKKCANENAQYIPKIRDLSVFNLT